MTFKGIEILIKSYPIKKTLSPENFFQVNFYQIFKEEILLILYKHFQKIENEEITSHLILGGKYYSDTKPKKITKKR